jgi:hypothetical protein
MVDLWGPEMTIGQWVQKLPLGSLQKVLIRATATKLFPGVLEKTIGARVDEKSRVVRVYLDGSEVEAVSFDKINENGGFDEHGKSG